MRISAPIPTIISCLAVAILFGFVTMRPMTAEVLSNARKDIYDEKADARAVIAEAVKQAKAENKNVLITWGGNWCGWCHLLHDTFETNAEINAVLTKEFIRVTVDSRSNAELMREMKVKTQGVPYLTVLNSSGIKVKDQATGPLEKDCPSRKLIRVCLRALCGSSFVVMM